MLEIEKLSETTLGLALAYMFHDCSIVSQHRVNDGLRTYIIDYYVETDTHKFAIEFDGPTHYCSTKTQLRDIGLGKYCDSAGINLVHVPYFVQMNDRTLCVMFDGLTYDRFNMSNKITTTYPSGFIDKKIIYPGDFNTYGWELFIKQYTELSHVDKSSANEIHGSLCHNVNDLALKLGVDWEKDQSKVRFVKNVL